MTASFSRDLQSPSPPPLSPQRSTSTPKRKRNDFILTSPTPSPEIRLNTNITNKTLIGSYTDVDTGSPRTKVACEFQGMQLEDRPAVSKLDFQRSTATTEDEIPEENVVRKKVKVVRHSDLDIILGKEREIPETPPSRDFKVAIRPERGVDATVVERAGDAVLWNPVETVIFKGSNGGKPKGGLARAYPSINRLADSKSRAQKKRMGTPPLLGSTGSLLEAEIDEAERRVVDPERAALTWHDDEITGHDPDDPDDDGEGINGIGFRPTPAMAYARTEKRRQQMAEYRNREAREARAKRNERRRGLETSKADSKDEGAEVSAEAKEEARRVRFFEGMVEGVIPTM